MDGEGVVVSEFDVSLQAQHIEQLQKDYNTPDYDIDWEEVKGGLASGMPGKWVSHSYTRTCTCMVIIL